MFFITGVVVMFFAILGLIWYRALQCCLVPHLLENRHAAKFSAALTRAVSELYRDMWKDALMYFGLACQSDEMEPEYVSFNYVRPVTPVTRCPPTEYLLSPPKEEVQPAHRESTTGRGRRGRGRGRRIDGVHAPAPEIGQLPPPPVVRLPRPRGQRVLAIEIVRRRVEAPGHLLQVPDPNVPNAPMENQIMSPPPQEINDIFNFGFIEPGNELEL